MTHQIDIQERDLAAWEAWARWPNVWHAARAGGAFGAGVVALSVLIVDLQRVFRGTITQAHPLRSLLIGAAAIAASAFGIGLLSAGIAGGIRVFRTAYLSIKRGELAKERAPQTDGENLHR